MNAIGSQIKRPARWDEPFDDTISDEDVARLKMLDPFCRMDPGAFSRAVPLEGILKNDCRLLDLEKGDIIVREGDYGNSAFLILDGKAVVSLVSLPAEALGRKESRRLSWLESIAQLWKNSKHRESRDYAVQLEELSYVGAREDDSGTHIFLHDIPRVIPAGQSVELQPGEIFGEISALTRTPRSATVVAGSKTLLLEIRWQGFRDLLNRQTALRSHVEKLYRENSLRSHLREIELLKYLSREDIEKLAEETVFESYGDFRWHKDFQSISRKDISDRILSEPVIAAEGDYVNGLLLIRNGFARLSRQHGDGHQTIAYLGKGEVFGLRELVQNCVSGEQNPYMLSLRALGYVDILRIPTPVFEKLILPKIPAGLMPPVRKEGDGTGKQQRRVESRGKSMDPGLMEFLVENRFINGTMGMMIDLNRCTRCDDCVRACAATHNNNPRFIRQGKKHDHWMVANACMHCLDPVCMIGCPTGAIHRDPDSGLVAINDKTCIGCGTCASSCPYTNIQMVEISDRKGRPFTDDEGRRIVKATKCDLCAEQDGGPACQRACPHDALLRVDLSTAATVTSITTRS